MDHSRAFVRACRDEGMRIVWRIPDKPHYGGHIERLIGTQMGAVHLLPGSTFSNPGDRGDYRASKSARVRRGKRSAVMCSWLVGFDVQRLWEPCHRPWSIDTALR